MLLSAAASRRGLRSFSSGLRKGIVAPQAAPPSPASGILLPPYALTGTVPEMHETVVPLTDAAEVKAMSVACALAGRMRDYGGELVKPGVTTAEIDGLVHEAILAEGAYPSPLNYKHFPKSLCSSINEVICHGIPDDRPLEDGDIGRSLGRALLAGHGDVDGRVCACVRACACVCVCVCVCAWCDGGAAVPCVPAFRTLSLPSERSPSS